MVSLKKYHGLKVYICKVFMSYIYAIPFIKPVDLMKKLTAFVLLFGVFVGLGLEQAQAQTQIEIGPRLGLDIAGDVEEFFIGADSRFAVAGLPVLLNATFDWYFVDEPFLQDITGTDVDVSFFQLSFNALYEFGVDNETFSPYAGAGIGLNRSSVSVGNADASDTEFGVNLIGGATFGFGSLKPFAQAQISFGTPDLFTIGGGLLFSIGG